MDCYNLSSIARPNSKPLMAPEALSPGLHHSRPPTLLPLVPPLCPATNLSLGEIMTLWLAPCDARTQISHRCASLPCVISTPSRPSWTSMFCCIVVGDMWALSTLVVAFCLTVTRRISHTCVWGRRPMMCFLILQSCMAATTKVSLIPFYFY